MERSNKIFLVGFMGSGKTTLGKKLANKLQKPFFDLDAEIEKLANKTVAEIFDEKGEKHFRQLENEILKVLINKNEHFVLSLGGGTPCYHNNMELIKQAGISIYLKYNSGMLASRLLNAKTERPLIKGLNEAELNEYVANKLAEREVFYKQSELVVEGNNIKVEDLVDLIQ